MDQEKQAFLKQFKNQLREHNEKIVFADLDYILRDNQKFFDEYYLHNLSDKPYFTLEYKEHFDKIIST